MFIYGTESWPGRNLIAEHPPPCIEMLFLVLFMIRVPSLPARGNFEEMLV